MAAVGGRALDSHLWLCRLSSRSPETCHQRRGEVDGSDVVGRLTQACRYAESNPAKGNVRVGKEGKTSSGKCVGGAVNPAGSARAIPVGERECADAIGPIPFELTTEIETQCDGKKIGGVESRAADRTEGMVRGWALQAVEKKVIPTFDYKAHKVGGVLITQTVDLVQETVALSLQAIQIRSHGTALRV